MKFKPFHLSLALMVAPVVMTLLPTPALAASTALPWDSFLNTLQLALSGNTARVICLIAIFIAGVALVFGEDLGHFAKRMLMIVIAAAFLIGGAGFIGVFTPTVGAII